MIEVENELITALVSNLPAGAIKTFYQGEIDQPPRDYAPVLMLWINNTSSRAFDTASDISVFTGKIRIIFDINAYTKDTGVPTTSGVRIVQAPYALKQLIEARDVPSGSYSATSVMGILRSKSVIRGANYTFSNDFSIDYGKLAKLEFPNLVAEINFKVTAVPIRRPGF